MATGLEPLSWMNLLTSWTFRPWVTGLLAGALLAYAWQLGRIRRRPGAEAWPVRRSAAFMAAVAVTAYTTQGAVGVYGMALFWMHMVAHLLLIMVIPMLVAASTPISLYCAAHPNRAERVQRRLRAPALAALTHPLTGLALYTTVIAGTHLTGFMDFMAGRMWVHHTESALYLLSGYLFALPLIGNEPIRWRLSFPARGLLLGLSMPVDTLVGLLLLLQSTNPFPRWTAMRPDWAPSALADVHGGGAIMWGVGDMTMMAVILAIFGVWAFGTRQEAGAGRWLESVRSATMAEHTGYRAAQTGTAGQEVDLDSDERALQAYNAYLARLHQQQH